ncbi:hypothetical protein K7X08_034565 [Anisodus acutangulus]|uniref:Uncharacterized protein n=1 Tax=Anisodus acutangulus TaxID=402998 RepID=A0A9Q1LJJ0_9SOLA|nr:hypothetical protein K7X08_034565 [Anisodus acutangulus]
MVQEAEVQCRGRSHEEVVTSRASETSHTLRNSETAVADKSDSSNNFELVSKDFIADVEKNQRGRGANGSGSLACQPRTLDKNSAVTLKRPSISLSTTCVISCLPLLLLFSLGLRLVTFKNTIKQSCMKNISKEHEKSSWKS